MIRKIVLAGTAALMSAGLLTATSLPAEAAIKKYSNCTKLNKDYPHGIGKPGAKDHTSGTPVKNFKKSTAGYKKNKGRDRDKDGIACEKR